MAKRLLAVLAAAGLIVAAVLIRNAIDDNGDGSSDPARTTVPSGRLVEVWCLEDLRAVCEAAFGADVTLVVGRMDEALALLADAEVDDDLPAAWVTFAPLPDMAKDAVSRAGGPAAGVATSVDLVATTRLVVASRPDRASLLAVACPPPTLWRCIGSLAGRKWETIGGSATFQAVKPAFGDPTSSATALMVWASAVGQYLGTDSYSINDVNADDDFASWGRNLRAADPLEGRGDPLAELVLSRVQRDVAGGSEAAFSQLTGLALVGEPYGRVDVVVSGFAGTTLSTGRLEALRSALQASGWTVADATTPAASRPGPTTYIALQNTWKELG